MKITICLVFGLPGVGKSTICRCLLDDDTTSSESGGDNNRRLQPYHKCWFSFDKLTPAEIIFEEDDVSGGGLWKMHRENVIHLIESSIKKLSNANAEEASSTLKIVTDSETIQTNPELCSCFQNSTVSCDKEDDRHVLFVDDNLFYRSMRYRFYQIARQYACSFCQVYVHAPLDIVMGRNTGRRKSCVIPRDTILKMDEMFEIPDKQGYPWELNTLWLNNEDELNSAGSDELAYVRLLGAILNFVDESSVEIVPPLLSEEEIKKRESSRAANLENYVHQCDQLLRRWISTKMQAARTKSSSQPLLLGGKGGGGDSGRGGKNCGGKRELQALAKRLNASRKMYLEKLRSCRSDSVISNIENCDDWSEREIVKFEEFLIDEGGSID